MLFHTNMLSTCCVSCAASLPRVCLKRCFQASKWLSEKASADVNGGPHRQSNESHSQSPCLGWLAGRGVIYNGSTQPVGPGWTVRPRCVIRGQAVRMRFNARLAVPGVAAGCLFCDRRLSISRVSERFMVGWAASLICLALWQTFPALLILINGRVRFHLFIMQLGERVSNGCWERWLK